MIENTLENYNGQVVCTIGVAFDLSKFDEGIRAMPDLFAEQFEPGGAALGALNDLIGKVVDLAVKDIKNLLLGDVPATPPSLNVAGVADAKTPEGFHSTAEILIRADYKG